MLQKTTAVLFMLVMALLITLKHPVLGYCLCLDSYFTGNCVCQFTPPQPRDNSAVEEKTGSACPGCCANSVTSEPDHKQGAPVEPVPCDNCTKHLNIDVGDFVWQSSDKIPLATETTSAIPYNFTIQEFKHASASHGNSMSIRGDPPPGLYAIALPLYLRLSVLRL